MGTKAWSIWGRTSYLRSRWRLRIMFWFRKARIFQILLTYRRLNSDYETYKVSSLPCSSHYMTRCVRIGSLAVIESSNYTSGERTRALCFYQRKLLTSMSGLRITFCHEKQIWHRNPLCHFVLLLDPHLFILSLLHPVVRLAGAATALPELCSQRLSNCISDWWWFPVNL